jgi:hypothetical protein
MPKGEKARKVWVYIYPQAVHGPFGHICASQMRKWCHRTPEISTISLIQKCQFSAIFIRTGLGKFYPEITSGLQRSKFLSALDLRPG